MSLSLIIPPACIITRSNWSQTRLNALNPLFILLDTWDCVLNLCRSLFFGGNNLICQILPSFDLVVIHEGFCFQLQVIEIGKTFFTWQIYVLNKIVMDWKWELVDDETLMPSLHIKRCYVGWMDTKMTVMLDGGATTFRAHEHCIGQFC